MKIFAGFTVLHHSVKVVEKYRMLNLLQNVCSKQCEKGVGPQEKHTNIAPYLCRIFHEDRR